MSLFDVLGPVMTGPSSSATAGACRIGLMGRMLLGGEPETATVCFTESFGCKYSGNRTHAALVGGLLGYPVAAPEIREATEITARRGMAMEIRIIPDPPPAGDGPQPISITVTIKRGNREVAYTGLSVGGGEIVIAAINGMPAMLTGTENAVCVFGEAGPEEELAGVLNTSEGWKRGDDTAMLLLPAPPAPEAVARLERLPGVRWVAVLRSLLEYELKDPVPLFTTIQDMVDYCAAERCTLADAALAFEKKRSGLAEEATMSMGLAVWNVMRAAVAKGLEGNNAVLSGLADGSGGYKLAKRVREGRAFCGDTAGMASAMALACMEYNACMGRVVAAPTAGACGVLPGALAAAAAKLDAPEKRVVEALLVSALIGVVIATRAPVSGTMGGCQSEVGVASAMAAAALVYLEGGDAARSSHAVAIALKNILGLVCDPVAGAVEVPCVKRNAMGVVNAMVAADMALAGITSAIPADDTVTALCNVQVELPPSLRNSGCGGLCASPTARRLTEERYKDLARKAGLQ
ncbi:MAG: L-serine ammonia-lyase, iron-sulfur-dependent, subunit alpha [Deltaproteobacteria bacterium]|nr:L-serine ammonia-lyase, iron-sulfur-dependent, subunit alpha [Deltaproteobacteria bacterium]